MRPARGPGFPEDGIKQDFSMAPVGYPIVNDEIDDHIAGLAGSKADDLAHD
jgi:hypothetical protein